MMHFGNGDKPNDEWCWSAFLHIRCQSDMQRAGRSSGLPGPSTAVSAERGCATDIPSASIQPQRPHHRCACLPLYWLHVPERVQYNIAVLDYKVLH